MKTKPKLLGLLEDGTILEFLTDEGIECPGCNHDFLFCLANMPLGCPLLSLTPNELMAYGYARKIERDEVAENDRFIGNFTSEKWPSR